MLLVLAVARCCNHYCHCHCCGAVQCPSFRLLTCAVGTVPQVGASPAAPEQRYLAAPVGGF